MCWHRWDVKKTEKRIFFRWLDDSWDINRVFITAAILSVLTIALPAIVLKGFSLIGGFLVVVIMFLTTLVYAGCLAAGTDFIEKQTKLKDKVCLKCHLTILDASKAQRKVQEFYKVRKEKELSELELQAAIQRNADIAFKNRKEMWRKAEDV